MSCIDFFGAPHIQTAFSWLNLGLGNVNRGFINPGWSIGGVPASDSESLRLEWHPPIKQPRECKFGAVIWGVKLTLKHFVADCPASLSCTRYADPPSQGQCPSSFRFICFYRPAECNSFKPSNPDSLSQHPDLPNSQGRTSSVTRAASMGPSPLWRGQRGVPSQHESLLLLN